MTSIQVPGQVVAARYRLERTLARGGMGSVWVARHLQLDVDVAVKFMSAEATAAANGLARFEREAKACAKLKSSHIVQILDYGVENEVLHMVMELLSGEDLATRLERVRRLSLPAVASLLGQACKGLALAHEAGIVHRDLKPANIFLSREGSDEVVKLLDFGIAKAPPELGSPAETQTGFLVGSPNYMSPEHILDSKSVDWRSDLWSLGVIAFECLTGQEPFRGNEVGPILVGVCTGPIPVPSHIAPDLGPQVDAFFQVALARPREQRFQTAHDFAQALRDLVQGTSGLAPRRAPPRPSTPPRTPTFEVPLALSESVPPVAGTFPGGARPLDGWRALTGLTGVFPESVPDVQPAPPRKTRASMVLGLSAAALIAGVFLVVQSSQRSGAPPGEAAAAVAQASEGAGEALRIGTSPAEALSVTPSPPGPTADGIASSEVPAASATLNPQASPKVTKPVPTPGSRPRGDCNPNYRFDAEGHKHFKLECFTKKGS